MKVLVVDDDVIQRMLLADLLAGYEYVEVVAVADGSQAWEAVQNGLLPVLVCCDMLMPVMPGIELLRKFKACRPLAAVPFIFVTAAGDRQTIEKAIAAGATDYILKPVNFIKARTSLDRVFHRIYERYGETPRATQQRLKISPGKLAGYYSMLRKQIADSRPLMVEQSAAGEVSSMSAALDSLKSACNTLGLWHAARLLECVNDLGAGLIDQVLTEADLIVEAQLLAAQREYNLREMPKPAKDEAAAPGPATQTPALAEAHAES